MSLSFPTTLYRQIEDGKPLVFDSPGDTKLVRNHENLLAAVEAGWLVHPLKSSKEKDANGNPIACHDSLVRAYAEEAEAWLNRKAKPEPKKAKK